MRELIKKILDNKLENDQDINLVNEDLKKLEVNIASSGKPFFYITTKITQEMVGLNGCNLPKLAELFPENHLVNQLSIAYRNLYRSLIARNLVYDS